MSVSGAIEVAIGLVFTYFIFSSICSGINEGIARVLNSRGTQLFQSINALIGDAEMAKDFWKHDLIAPLLKSKSKAGAQQSTQANLIAGIKQNPQDGSISSSVSRTDRKVLPSYISPTTVVTVMKAVAANPPDPPIVPAADSVAAPTGFWGVHASFKTALANDEQQLQAVLEKWFNDAMDRLSGWYKRFVQVILLGLAILVTIGFNVSTIHVAEELWRQPTLQAAVSAEANQAAPSQSQGQTTQQPQSLETDFNEAATLPVGWGAANRPQGGVAWLLTVLGWLLTIGALTFGAPFWFDLLTRMNSLRATGPPATTS
jgi:hypothetical protein